MADKTWKAHERAIPIPEKDWTKQVIDLAHLYHWRVAHFRAAMTKHGWRTPVQADGKGFPDLVLVRKERLIFVELKSEKGKPTDDQMDWLNALWGVPEIEVGIWVPSDFDRVQEILK